VPYNWNRSFRKDVPLKPGEVCDWPRHFRMGVLRDVMTYLEAQAKRHPIERFTWVRVSTILVGCSKHRKQPYSHAAVEAALTFLTELGIIARVSQMEIEGRICGGYLVALHDHACKPIEGRCSFWCGGLSGLRFNKPGVRVTAAKFHGPTCDCADCVYGRERRAKK